MKRVVLYSTLVLFLVITPTVFGQVEVGLTAGANFTTISSDSDVAAYDSRVLLAFGGILDVGIGNRLALRFEPMYVQKGAESHYNNEQTEVRYAGTLDYLELPILLTYSFAESKGLRPYLTFGPSIGVNLGADFFTRLPGGIAGTTEADISDEINLIDFGIAFGIGTRIDAGAGSFFIGSRYTLGLTNIFDNPHESECCDFLGPVDLNNRGLQVLTGYTFPIGSDRKRLP